MACGTKKHRFYCTTCKKVVEQYAGSKHAAIMLHYRDNHPRKWAKMKKHVQL